MTALHMPTLQYVIASAKKTLLFIAALLFVLLPVSEVLAIEPAEATWVDGPMPEVTTMKEGSQSIPECFPTTFPHHGFESSHDQLGEVRDVDICAMQNELGFFGSQTFGGPVTSPHSYNFVKPHTSLGFRTVLGSRVSAGVIPVPSQGTFILARGDSSTSQGGRHLRFYDSFTEAGSFERRIRRSWHSASIHPSKHLSRTAMAATCR